MQRAAIFPPLRAATGLPGFVDEPMPAYDAVLLSITRRDATDSTRARDPLKVAEGAIVIQTTQMSIGQVADLIVSTVSRKEG